MVNTGRFVPPVTEGLNIEYGQLAHTLDTKGGIPSPTQGGGVYSKREPTMYVYIMWAAKQQEKSIATLRVYDLDNRMISSSDLSKPLKINLSKGDRKVLSVPISPSSFSPGFYRVDRWLDDKPAWRKFFEVTE